jgi:hypothetical protein
MLQKESTHFMGTESERYHPRSALETEYGTMWIWASAMSDSSYPRILDIVQDGAQCYCSINIPYGPIRTEIRGASILAGA